MRQKTYVLAGRTRTGRRVWRGHRYPGWMPLKLHLILEGLMEPFREIVSIISLWELYDFVHGVICGYPLRDILRYLEKGRRAKRILSRSVA